MSPTENLLPCLYRDCSRPNGNLRYTEGMNAITISSPVSPAWMMWGLCILAAFAYLLVALSPIVRRLMPVRDSSDYSPNNRIGTRIVLLLAATVHGASLILLLYASPPRFGFAPACSVTAWLVVVVYFAESRFMPAIRTHWQLAGLGVAAVMLPLLFPGAPLKNPSPGLLAHLLLGMASYALFACAVLHAWFLRMAETRLRKHGQSLDDMHQPPGLPVMTLERLMFAFVWAGFVLLTITALAGWLFGESLYGSPLSIWNRHLAHKIFFACTAWLVFAVLLVGRYRLGWRGRKAALMVYAGGASLLLSYIGSHFVLEVVLQRI